jgi:hypothetical protein
VKEERNNIMTKNKTKKIVLISKSWMFSLVLITLMVFSSIGYAALIEKTKEDSSKEKTLLDPFQLITYKVDSEKKSDKDKNTLSSSSATIRPAIRIPFRPELRSPFRPTGLNW